MTEVIGKKCFSKKFQKSLLPKNSNWYLVVARKRYRKMYKYEQLSYKMQLACCYLVIKFHNYMLCWWSQSSAGAIGPLKQPCATSWLSVTLTSANAQRNKIDRSTKKCRNGKLFCYQRHFKGNWLIFFLQIFFLSFLFFDMCFCL